MTLRRIRAAALAMACTAAFAVQGSRQADAAFVFTFAQDASGVTLTGSGGVNTAGLFRLSVAFTESFVVPSSGSIAIAGRGLDLFLAEPGIRGPAGFGSGSGRTPSGASGDGFLLLGSSADPGLPRIGLPRGYVSGSEISNSLTFDGATFASLGLSPGTYTYSLGTGENVDTVQVRIGVGAPVPVPAPAGVLVFGSGLLALAAARRVDARAPTPGRRVG